jgi:hypothetical protein
MMRSDPADDGSFLTPQRLPFRPPDIRTKNTNQNPARAGNAQTGADPTTMSLCAPCRIVSITVASFVKNCGKTFQ